MRRRDEAIEVRHGRIGEGISGLESCVDEGPAQFLWRDRVWRVLGVQGRWIESGAWWTMPGACAARGDEPGDEGWSEGADDPDDLLCEHEVWRVEAANGREGSRGIYELAHATGSECWQLRAVVD